MRKILLLLLAAARLSTAFFSPLALSCAPRRQIAFETVRPSPLQSSFYEDFEEFEQEDDVEDDDDDEDDDRDMGVDDKAVADFRTRMTSLFEEKQDSSIDELISFAVSGAEKAEDWAKEADELKPGCILCANPESFCEEFGKGKRPNPKLLAKFGLTLPPPVDLGPDRRADLLPVLVVVESSPKTGQKAVLLNRRTGYLLGDLEQQQPVPGASSQPLLEKFCIQPLWFGGINNADTGLDMLHVCPAVKGCTEISSDGLFWGGDPAQAQEAMGEGDYTGFDFKFFVQSTVFAPGELKKEVDAGVFFAAEVSKEVLFKSRDRMGSRRAKPLWTEIMELLSGKYQTVKDMLYESDASDLEDYS